MAVATCTLAKQGEHLEQDSKSTRMKLRPSQPDGAEVNKIYRVIGGRA